MTKVQQLITTAHTLCLPIAGVAVFYLTGCGESAPQPATSGTSSMVAENASNGGAADHEHAHPSEGPHHGDLVELGGEEYHAEVVHGEGGTVSVYILDGSATAAVPIVASELSINVSHDGKAAQFKLAADRDSSDPEGKSSRFSLASQELAAGLDSHDAVARLVVSINGKSYSGKITHRHDGDHKH